MYDELRTQVCEANRLLSLNDLACLTWGNVSAYDHETGHVIIKPSGIRYKDLTPAKMVVVDMTGKTIEGTLRPSSDLDTHLELYKAFPSIKAIAHTHSIAATAFAQARRPVPCYGTTHADTFYGEILVTRLMTEAECASEYETNTGRVIVETLQHDERSPADMPGILVANHGPFTWGDSPIEASENSLILEQVCKMALNTLLLDPSVSPIANHLRDRHFFRKHGQQSYYGQCDLPPDQDGND